MSRIERKYCLISTSYLAGFFDNFMYSSLWKRVIAWGRSRAASTYGIIWGDAGQNKHGGI